MRAGGVRVALGTWPQPDAWRTASGAGLRALSVTGLKRESLLIGSGLSSDRK